MITPPSWSSVFQGIIKTTSERQRLASALSVTNMTLSRWASGESNPQKNHLIRLLRVVHPNQRQELLEALEKEYPEIHSWLAEDTPEQIPSEFFAQILNLRTTTTESLLFWRITDAVLKQALVHMDPHSLGMAIRVIQCMPPAHGGKIRSLRERAGKGTYPWASELEHDVHFLGMESLSGNAMKSHHIVWQDDLRERSNSPVIRSEHEISAAATPIRFEGRVAGCLLASSTQPKYFTPQRLNLLSTYGDLIALAFKKSEFYLPMLVELRVLPLPAYQNPVVATFRQRFTEKFQQTTRQQQPSNAELELQVWQDIETELLQNLPEEAYQHNFAPQE